MNMLRMDKCARNISFDADGWMIVSAKNPLVCRAFF